VPGALLIGAASLSFDCARSWVKTSVFARQTARDKVPTSYGRARARARVCVFVYACVCVHFISIICRANQLDNGQTPVVADIKNETLSLRPIKGVCVYFLFARDVSLLLRRESVFGCLHVLHFFLNLLYCSVAVLRTNSWPRMQASKMKRAHP